MVCTNVDDMTIRVQLQFTSPDTYIDIINWCFEHLGNHASVISKISKRYCWMARRRVSDGCVFYFHNNEDAALFRLTWL